MWPTHYIPKQDRVEGVPPPRYYLTTPPYPIELTEALQSDGDGPQRLGFVPFASLEEEFQSAGIPVGGTIDSILVTTSVEPEEIESVGVPVSGILVEMLIRIEVEDELIESVGIPVSGILRDPLVVYDNWPLGADTEDLQSAGVPVSGVLA